MFKPTLASPVDLDKLQFPVMASPKFDGIRAVNMVGNGLVSRNIKAIPNEFIRDTAYRLFPVNFDGEIMTFTDGKIDDFSTLSGKVMSRDGEPDFKFYVFDNFTDPSDPFRERIYSVVRDIHELGRQGSLAADYLHAVEHVTLNNLAELLEYEDVCVKAGWEGVMLRSPLGHYKFGRSTTREGLLLKMKRFFDAEATIVDFVEREINNNEQTRDNLGRAKRSTAKAGKAPAGDLGTLVCLIKAGTTLEVGPGKPAVALNEDVKFEIGTGFTADQRVEFWQTQELLRGRSVRFKYQELSKDMVPRFPVYQGLRNPIDM